MAGYYSVRAYNIDAITGMGVTQFATVGHYPTIVAVSWKVHGGMMILASKRPDSISLSGPVDCF